MLRKQIELRMIFRRYYVRYKNIMFVSTFLDTIAGSLITKTTVLQTQLLVRQKDPVKTCLHLA